MLIRKTIKITCLLLALVLVGCTSPAPGPLPADVRTPAATNQPANTTPGSVLPTELRVPPTPWPNSPPLAASLELLAETGSGVILGVQWALDGSRMAVGTRAGVHIFASGETPAVSFTAPGWPIYTMALSPQGDKLALVLGRGDEYPAVSLWDAASGEELSRLTDMAGGNTACGRGYDPAGMAFSLDGARLAEASPCGGLRIWEVSSGRLLLNLEGDYAVLAFSPDGARLAASQEDRVVEFDAQTGAELGRTTTFSTISRLAYSPDGKMLAVLGSRLDLYAVGSGEKRVEIQDPNDFLQGEIVFSPDGKEVAVRGQVWSAVSGERLRSIQLGAREAQAVFDPSLTQIVSYTQEQVISRDGKSGTVKAVLLEGLSLRGALAFSFDSTRLALLDRDQGLWLWDLERSSWAASDMGLPAGTVTLAFSPNWGPMALGGVSELWVWNPVSSAYAQRLEGHRGGVSSLVFSPDGKTLFSGGDSDGVVIQWDVSGGQAVRALEGLRSVRSLQLTRDGAGLIAGGYESHCGSSECLEAAVHVWDPASGARLQTFLLGDVRIGTVAPGPDDSSLVVCISGAAPTLLLLDLLSGQVIESLDAPVDTRDCTPAVHPNGRLLAFNASPEIILWDLSARQEVARVAGSLEWIDALAFSPDGRYLAATGSDGVLRVWAVEVEVP